MAEQDLLNFPGSLLSVETALGEKVEGTLFNYNAAADCLILETKGNLDGSQNFTLFPRSTLKSCVLVKKCTEVPAVLKNLPRFKPEEIEKRERDTLEERKQMETLIGQNVDNAAQMIFDSLQKTMPCKWDGTDILVMGEVRITAPYTSDDCSGSNATFLGRVRRVLILNRKKLKL